jgi:hypothetical protein
MLSLKSASGRASILAAYDRARSRPQLEPSNVSNYVAFAETALFEERKRYPAEEEVLGYSIDNCPDSTTLAELLPMQDEAQHVLLCTEGRMATWIDNNGGEWTLFAFRWAPGRTATQSARLHRPENCFTASGAVLKGFCANASRIDG